MASNYSDESFNLPGVDKTGLTVQQKIALSSAWMIIKQDIDSHAKKIFIK